MTSLAIPSSRERPRKAAVVAGVLAMALGAVVLIGWATRSRMIASFGPGLVAMKANAAVAFILLGLSLALLAVPKGTSSFRFAARISAVLAIAIGAATFAERGTSVGFILSGIALLLIERRPAEWLAITTGVIALVVLAGYAYAKTTLPQMVSYTGVPLPATFGFLILAAGTLLARPQRGLMRSMGNPGASGAILRRLIPAAFIIPTLIAWLAQEGERLGVYEDPIGIGAMAVGTILSLAAVIILTARWLEASEGGRRAAEADLRASEASYRGLFESAPVGLCRSAADGTILAANDMMARILGRSDSASVVGMNASELYANPADRAPMRAELEATGRSTIEVEWRKADGTTTWVQSHARRIDATGSDELQYEGAIIDISIRKRLETQFHQAQKMEAVGRLAGGIAHDFNNMLTVIRSYCDLVLLEIPENGPHRSDMKEISAAAERAAGLARQLLAFSRKQVLMPQLLDPNAAAQDVVKLLSRVLPSTVACTLRAAEVGTIRADPGHIDQLLMNLAINAADAMPDGGSLTIETANVRLDEAYAAGHVGVRPGEYVMIAVSDTGTGMDQATLSHIFEPFFTTKPVGKGTGLGLATVYGVVEQNQGHIWVYSELGQGTTFKVYFPRVAEAPEARVARISVQDMKCVELDQTVLVVEDDDSVRATIVRVLERQGYTVLSAEHGGEGVRVGTAHKGPIDLVISDVMMPELGGREFVERLAKLHPESRVLLMSGYTDDDVLRRGLIDPSFAFLEKPFTVEQLVRKVEGVLS